MMRYELMERILENGVNEGTVEEAFNLYKEAEEQETDLQALLTDEDYYPDWETRNDVTPFR